MTDIDPVAGAGGAHHIATASINQDGTPSRSRGPDDSGGLSSGDSTTSASSTGSETIKALEMYPHLGHYVVNLLQSLQGSPQRTISAVHPLSVSSSGESDDEDTANSLQEKLSETQKSSRKPLSNEEKDQLVHRVVDCLDNEDEDGVKDLLKPHLGDMASDDILLEQVCLDCMHKRRDDQNRVPFASLLTPSRSRPPAAVSQPIARPYTPTRIPSFRSRTPLARPASPAPGSQTPTLPKGDGMPSPGLASTGYFSPSPSNSPRLLNAKALSFAPSPKGSPRAVSSPLAASTSTSSHPSDAWKDASAEQPRAASPFIGHSAMVRTNSNLAIAPPLFSSELSPWHSPAGTPNKVHGKVSDPFSVSTPPLPTASSKGYLPDDDEEDEFSPFGSSLPKKEKALNLGAKPFEPGASSQDEQNYASSMSDSNSSQGDYDQNDAYASMTPLDVLTQIFSSVPRIELEEALHQSGYDFESAMGLLMARYTLPRSGSTTPQRVSSPRPLLGVGSRGALATAHHGPSQGYFVAGGRHGGGTLSPGGRGVWGPASGTRSPGGPPTRMCRYFLQGECRRSDCRFSHDLDRAMCRFWLRGHCGKGPNCEFLHQFPNNLDPSALSNAMSRVELSSDGSARSPGMEYRHVDEFPDLGNSRGARQGRFDPSRNRFANAVKRAAPTQLHAHTVQITGARPSPAYAQGSDAQQYEPAAPVQAVPRPSRRIKLHPPTLLPTIKTGSAANEQYLNARAVAIRLGHARNACLARAADAFRRGDGAAAKRFSREGRALNEKMLNEGSDAAQSLVRQRMREAQAAVRERDLMWSDDPGDRSARGRECAGGLGVIMGVASKRRVPGGDVLSAEERMECLLDLHTLHGTEGSEIAAQFLGELERETYRGLAYVLVGEEKHVGMQDPGRGASKVRLAASVKQTLAEWGYPWSESAGILCIDPCRF